MENSENINAVVSTIIGLFVGTNQNVSFFNDPSETWINNPAISSESSSQSVVLVNFHFVEPLPKSDTSYIPLSISVIVPFESTNTLSPTINDTLSIVGNVLLTSASKYAPIPVPNCVYAGNDVSVFTRHGVLKAPLPPVPPVESAHFIPSVCVESAVSTCPFVPTGILTTFEVSCAIMSPFVVVGNILSKSTSISISLLPASKVTVILLLPELIL